MACRNLNLPGAKPTNLLDAPNQWMVAMSRFCLLIFNDSSISCECLGPTPSTLPSYNPDQRLATML